MNTPTTRERAERIVRDAKAKLRAFDYFWSRWPEDKQPAGSNVSNDRLKLIKEGQVPLAKHYERVMKSLELPGHHNASNVALHHVETLWSDDEALIELVEHSLAIPITSEQESVAERWERYT